MPTKSKIKVYTFVDGTDHIFYNNDWYDLMSVKDLQLKPTQHIKFSKTIEEINKSKAHKPSSNHPWVKQGLKRLSQGRTLVSSS